MIFIPKSNIADRLQKRDNIQRLFNDVSNSGWRARAYLLTDTSIELVVINWYTAEVVRYFVPHTCTNPYEIFTTQYPELFI